MLRTSVSSAYLISFIVLCIFVVVVVGYYTFAKIKVPVMVPAGQDRVIRHPFGATVGNVCTILSPLFSLLLALEVFKVVKSVEKKT